MAAKLNYINLSDELSKQIACDRAGEYLSPFACKDWDCVRRADKGNDRSTPLRPAFIRDVDKIMNTPYYVRYADKTQVFSLHKNDDISRRAYHVQLVSRIARNIGRALNLNLDLIEAIALGHDLGHTPFGHDGERVLSEIYHKKTGQYFNHNIQSARILDVIFPVNASLQTLDGIICHNGELELGKYEPYHTPDFDAFDAKMKKGLTKLHGIDELCPGTLEGCVVRVSDIIAYLGKDRQDAIKLGLVKDSSEFDDLDIGKHNAEIINNMTVNIVENSYGKPYLKLDENYFTALKLAKKENFKRIYKVDSLESIFDEQIAPMFEAVYERLLDELTVGKKDSYIFTHHMDYVKKNTEYYSPDFAYEHEKPEDIVTDYIASMTDDYFIDLYEHLFPESGHEVMYIGYFD